MSGKRAEVTAQLEDVHGHLPNRLRRVQQQKASVTVRQLRQLPHGQHLPGRIRDVRKQDQTQRRRCRLLKPRDDIFSRVLTRHAHNLQRHTQPIASVVGRHDHRRVLAATCDDLVARLQSHPEQHRVDPVGGRVLNRDLVAARADQPGKQLPRAPERRQTLFVDIRRGWPLRLRAERLLDSRDR